MILKKTLISILVLFFFPIYSHAGSAPIEIGILDFPPYYVLGVNDEVEGGILVEMLAKIFKRAEIEVTFAGYPPKRLYSNLGKGITQVWLGTKGVEDYEGKTVVSPQMIVEINLHVFSSGKNATLPKNMEELKGKSVITIHGYNYGGLIKFLENPANNITLEKARTHESAFRMLQMERAEYVLDYIEPASSSIEKLKITNLKHAPIQKIPLFIHISDKVPNAQQQMDKVMKAYYDLKKEGSIDMKIQD